jgi:hypothetical protein
MAAPSAIATETVAAQIAGLEGEVKRIDEQIAALQARREGMVMMQEALRPLVDPARHTVTVTGNKSILSFEAASMAVLNTSLIGKSVYKIAAPTGTVTGFRDAVRQVLRDNPKGLRPRQVLFELDRRGELARYTGKVKPSVRVHNELYLLRKSGEVLKRGGSKYAIRQEGTPAAVN